MTTAPQDWHDEPWVKEVARLDSTAATLTLDAASQLLLGNPAILSDPLNADLSVLTEALRDTHPELAREHPSGQ